MYMNGNESWSEIHDVFSGSGGRVLLRPRHSLIQTTDQIYGHLQRH